jgi:hypothetical protein
MPARIKEPGVPPTPSQTGSSSRGSGENHRWRGIEELAPVMFSNAKDIEADFISESDCFE